MTEQVAEEAIAPSTPRRRDWLGSLVGLAVFLGGIGLIILVFRLAYDMYQVPPKVTLKVQPGKPLDIADTVNAFIGIVVRIIFLLFMAGAGFDGCESGNFSVLEESWTLSLRIAWV